MNKSDASRYVIGIDLGTTNCALSYVDTKAGKDAPPVSLAIPQWETEGTTVAGEMLPSFYYVPVKAEHRRGQLKLPFHQASEPPDFAVGRLARLKASLVPGRVVHSAKSWLCHGGVSREDRILPWHSDEVIGDERRSPIEVSAAYLEHLRLAWDAALGDFAAQDVTITVPASFDEVAQRLTLDAAAMAGFDRARVRLLEEPQAAFYYWLSKQGQTPTGTVLICDIGGGTSDFSLFNVEAGAGGRPDIERIAVSEHLLLGGDNIDLALAHALERKMVGEGRKLSSRQWAQLVFESRKIKEKALSEMGAAGSDELFVSVAGEGASLFASTLTASLTRAEIEAQILDGFLPRCDRDAQPRKQRSGLLQLGLPYAQDTAMTRHLAAFLAGRRVDAVLFTGGTLKPPFVRERLVALISEWQGQAPLVLDNDAMDLAVAHGAACYGAVLRREVGRIKSGYPRSLYIEAARAGGAHALVCVVPKGFDGHAPLSIEGLGLKVRTDRPVRFQLFSSIKRDKDAIGDVVPLDADMFHPLAPLHTKLDLAGGKSKGDTLVDIALEVRLSETGILQLTAAAGERRWQLDFNVRAAAQQLESDRAQSSPLVSQTIPEAKLKVARDKLDSFFGKRKLAEFEADNPKYLVRDLEEVVGRSREDWDTPFLRSLWPHLEQGLTRRGRSLGHEVSWLYLAGYSLRPGYGYELDEWRVAELWRAWELGMSFSKERQVEEQWWIMWRRVAGGLTRDQQDAIFAKIFPMVLKGEASSHEVYMLAGSLERLEMSKKIRLGNQLVQHIAFGKKQYLEQRMWALGRIASRVPLYGGPESIVRPKFIGDWFRELEGLDMSRPPYKGLLQFLAQAGRMVGDREFDLPEDLREAFLEKLVKSGATEEQQRVVREHVAVDTAARAQLFGESLPTGLVLA
jgi:molecular chaperone DnaK (HSP70)